MKLRWLWWLVPLYVIGLVVYAPASLLQWLLPAGSGISLSNLTGTLWQGQGSVTVVLAPQRSLQLEQVSWRLHPRALLRGQAALDVTIPAHNVLSGHLTTGLTVGGTAELNGRLSGQLDTAIRTFNLPVPLTMAGDWQLVIDNYHVDDLNQGRWCNQLAGKLTTTATQTRVNQRWLDLGDYATALSCTSNQEISAKLNADNSLGLSFNGLVAGTFQAPEVKLQGKLQPHVRTPREVTDVLIFLGEPDSRGAYPFSLTLK